MLNNFTVRSDATHNLTTRSAQKTHIFCPRFPDFWIMQTYRDIGIYTIIFKRRVLVEFRIFYI